MSDIELKELNQKHELQVAKCEARWQSIETALKETQASLHEILNLLRGEGTHTGLVGKVESNRQKLDSASKVLRALWVLIAGIVVAVVSNIIRGK